MKKLIGALATVCCLTAAPVALAGVDVFVEISAARPVVVMQPVQVVHYRQLESRRHGRREHFYGHRDYHERHEPFRRHGRR